MLAARFVNTPLAIIIGCGPMFASVVPKGRSQPTIPVSHDSRGYVRQSPNRSNESGSHRLKRMLSSKGREKTGGKTLDNISISRTGHDSQEELPERRTGGTGILITEELRKQHRQRLEEDRRMEEAGLKTEKSIV